ncbi:hypothetical protein LCGC14_2843280 [marine sediment metagenome]|uniref:YqaJ viral recombinase domain-containing protein n=1 Tax=marine sediment metagenome TaxID=412755 RepID=A0A0F8YAQ9_9ZZZZ
MQSKEQWLEKRSQGVGASEMPAVMGVSPYTSQYKLWAHKTRRLGDEIENEDMYWGKKLEHIICDEYALRSERAVQKCGPYDTNVHPDIPYMFATPDALTFRNGDDLGPGDDMGPVEAKMQGRFAQKEWDEGAPLIYQIQLQAQMAVLGTDYGVLCGLVGKRFKSIEIERDDKFIDAMTDQLHEFWDYVANDTPPPMDGLASTARALKRMHPQDNGKTIKLSAEMSGILDGLIETRVLIKSHEEMETLQKNNLVAALKENTFGRLPDGRIISYKTIDVKPEKQPRDGYSYRRMGIKEAKNG